MIMMLALILSPNKLVLKMISAILVVLKITAVPVLPVVLMMMVKIMSAKKVFLLQ